MSRIFQRGKGGTWYMDFVDGQGRPVRKAIGTDKRVAELALRDKQLQSARRRTGLFPTVDNSITIADLRRKFEALYYPELRPSTRRRMTYGLDCALAKLTSAETVADLRPEAVQEYIRERRREVGDRTVGIELGCLNRLLNWASNPTMKIIAENPVKQVKAPPRPNPMYRRALTGQECQALLAASPERYRQIWEMFLLTGLRRGELCSLTWGDVDLKDGTITIRPENSKTNAGRTIPVHRRVLEILSGLHREHLADRKAAETRLAAGAVPDQEKGRLRAQAERRHVLVTASGLPWERATENGKAQGHLLQRFKDCCVKAGIVDQKAVEARKSLRESVLAKKRRGESLTEGERWILRDPAPFRGCVSGGVTLHALRRTFVTNLIRAGANIKTVAELAGHKDPKITLAIYAQFTSADLRGALSLLGGKPADVQKTDKTDAA